MSHAPGGADALPDEPRPGGLDRLVERLSVVLALIAGGILVAISLVVSANVLGRWLLGTEMTGAFEVVQVGVAVAAFLMLPMCQIRNHNIIVDAFTTRASPRVRAALDALWSLVYAAVALVLAWRLAIGAEETIRYATVTPMMQIPFGWAMVVGAAALVFLALVAVLVAVRHLRGGYR
jgi:TRAP-type C4-dicarboxylate transport system permease small subunit